MMPNNPIGRSPGGTTSASRVLQMLQRRHEIMMDAIEESRRLADRRSALLEERLDMMAIELSDSKKVWRGMLGIIFVIAFIGMIGSFS